MPDAASVLIGPAEIAEMKRGAYLVNASRGSVVDLDALAARLREHGLEPADAYALCSLAADLKISEVVDQPNWVVSAHLPLSIFV